MKKLVTLMLLTAMMLSLVSCGSGGKWERYGYFSDTEGNTLYISDPGEDAEEWYVEFSDGKDVYTGYCEGKGSKLTGMLECELSEDAVSEMEITLTNDGKDGVKAKIKDASTCKMTHAETAPIVITIDTDGFGFIRALTESREPDSDGYVSSMDLDLMVPVVYELTARGENDWAFVKWTKNGEDFSADRKLTVTFSETADYVAVFEYPRIHTDDVGQYGDSHEATFYEYPSDFIYSFINGNADSGTLERGGFTTLEYEDLENFLGSSPVRGIFDLPLSYSDNIDHAVVYSAGGRSGGRWGLTVLGMSFNSPENAQQYYQTLRDGLSSAFSSAGADVKEGLDEGVTYITGRASGSYGTVGQEGIYLEGSCVLIAVSSESGTTRGTEAMTNLCEFFIIPDPKG